MIDLVLPTLYVICDSDVCDARGWSVTDFTSACLDGGARLFQLRAKSMPSGRLFDETVALTRLAHQAGALFVLNDRADLARMAETDGVHLGQEDLPPRAVRSIVGPESVVGLSTHTPTQIERAILEPVSYLAVGPVFGTATKDTGYDAVGLDLVRYAAHQAHAQGLPLVAIGGITLERAPWVLEAGAQSVAVITDLFLGEGPTVRVRQFLAALA